MEMNAIKVAKEINAEYWSVSSKSGTELLVHNDDDDDDDDDDVDDDDDDDDSNSNNNDNDNSLLS